jgi:hypothetical protein
MPTLLAATGADRVGVLAGLPADQRTSLARHVRELVVDLIAPLEFEATRVTRAILARWARLVTTAVLLTVLVITLGNRLDAKTHPNIALHCKVSASSLNDYGPDPSKLVDGITDEIAFHTNGGDQQWVVIDLGEVKRFDRIVVYNRPGCCADRAVPLKIEVSNDNMSYRQIAERTESFEKWTARNLHAEGRYVRLKNTPPNFFHLAEVEIR